MYYNIDSYTPDMDRLFKDYTNYRLGQGWPAYKKVTVAQMADIIDDNAFEPRYDTKPGTSTNSAEQNKSDLPKRDIELMKALYNDINVLLNGFVQRIIDRYEYMESPIYSDDGIGRETLAQIVDDVLNLAKEETDEAQEISLENNEAYLLSRLHLYRSLIEALVLAEIFAVRRPNYRRVRGNYFYNGGVYDGVRER